MASAPLLDPGIGRARWRVTLERCRGGDGGEWLMEACDAQGCLGLPAELGHGQVAAA
jgi:protein ImuA